MLKKAICPECGSHDIRFRAYIRVDLPIEEAQGEITKDIIAKESARVIDDGEYPVMKIYCGECNYTLEKEIDIKNPGMFPTECLTDEICRRINELQAFKEQTFDEKLRQEIEANDFSSKANDFQVDGYAEINRVLGTNLSRGECENSERPAEEGGYIWD